jgi:hypothetical protein
MTIEELFALRNDSAAPFDHMEYTIWLHNKIIERINYEIWQVREHKKAIDLNGYVVCNKIISLPVLKKIQVNGC